VGYDVVIRNGTVVDGTGMAAYRADVGIADGTIVTIGRIRERGATDIDADGHVVTPGFIDGHTHLDAQIFWDELGTNSCWHGVTTAVMGHCGFTLAPAEPDRRHLVLRNLERAEDISGAAMASGIEWTWTTFAEYLDAVERRPKGINYAANLGHSALRTFVMGERAFDGAATDDDRTAMANELSDALRAGAFGLSTSRTEHHQTSDDRPVASRLAAWEEVVELVGVLGDLGVGTFQIVDDPAPADDPARDDRLVDLAVDTGVRIAIPAVSSYYVQLIDAAARRGGHIFGLTHCRGIGTMSSFRTQLPFDRLPEWCDLRRLPIDEQERALRVPGVIARLVDSAHGASYERALGGDARAPEFDRMQVLDQPVPPNPTVADAAAARSLDPVELMIQLALETNLNQFFVQTNQPFDHDETKRVLRHSRTVMAFSDSGAHVSQMSDASLPTHLLAHWVRDGGDFTIEDAVRMLTLAPARAWGFHDRGLLREGLVADVNVFDPERVAPAMPKVVHDLPAGEKRIEQKSVGFLATLVAGEVLIADGEPTGARPGRLIRSVLPRSASRA
jgi:N-acyl-D-aspartate/D-glutamate deacylase